MATPKIENWLIIIKENWNLIAQVATWIVAIGASIVLSPVKVIFGDDSTAVSGINNFAIFIVTPIVGITFLIAQQLSGKKYVLLWAISAFLFLILASFAIFKNYDLNIQLLCHCSNKLTTIKGTDLKPGIRDIMPNPGCSDICQFADEDTKEIDSTLIWTEQSVNDSRRYLLISYLVCFPVVSLTIISIIQALFCSQQKPQKKTRKKTLRPKPPLKVILPNTVSQDATPVVKQTNTEGIKESSADETQKEISPPTELTTLGITENSVDKKQKDISEVEEPNALGINENTLDKEKIV